MSLSYSNITRDDLLRAGCQHQAAGRWSDALTSFEQAVRISPHDLQTLIQLGFVLIHLKQWKRAAETYERIVPLLPRDFRVWSNLSYLYEHSGKMDLAEDRARKALRLTPDSGEVWNNLGMALRGQHRLALAANAFDQALIRQPDLALAEFNLATTQLLMGNTQDGWLGYESRHKLPEARLRTPMAPRWDGNPLPGESLLVYSDQGLGDTLQFLRFLPAVRDRSQAEITLSCARELLPLLQAGDRPEKLCSLEEEPTCAVEIPISSLPGLFVTNLNEIPGSAPYLKPQLTDLQPALAELLGKMQPGTLRVGLAWQGNPNQNQDYVRSAALARLAALGTTPLVSWISLQIGDLGRSQLAEVKDTWPLIDLGARLENFAETASILQHLDLVITVDTALAHLAGAMGTNVWTLLCHTPDWRWGLTGDSSPWYPTMRLFRQPQWGDWESVALRVKAALMELR